MKQEINVYQFEQAFKDMNRDYYSYEGYKALYDYYDEFEDFSLDVIAICCDVTEYDEEELKKDYGYLVDEDEFFYDHQEEFEEENFTKEETEEEINELYLKALTSAISDSTYLIELDNGNYLVWSF